MMAAAMTMENNIFPPVRGVLRRNEPMSGHTSWRVGGTADWFFVPADREDLCAFIAGLPVEMPLFWTGLGSNLLVRDGGIRGVVVATHKALDRISRTGGHCIRVQAGVAGAKVSRFASRLGLTGVEFLAGIPGTMGGALAMNAGAFGGETWQVVESVLMLNRQGQLIRRWAKEFLIGYRQVTVPRDGEWFVEADLVLADDPESAGRDRIRSLLSRRGASQPIQSANAGSVFRNPEGDYAARLIEDAGLKGLRIGAARVSMQHANFIINEGGASAADIESLIAEIQLQVLEKHGVSLQTEVRFVGESS